MKTIIGVFALILTFGASLGYAADAGKTSNGSWYKPSIDNGGSPRKWWWNGGAGCHLGQDSMALEG